MRTWLFLVLGVSVAVVIGIGACGDDRDCPDSSCSCEPDTDGDDSDCSDLSCSCELDADCPETGGYMCLLEICYPSQYPMGAPCNESTDCLGVMDCQPGIKLCVHHCDADTTCPTPTICQGNDCLPPHSLPLDATCSASSLCPVGVPCTANLCTPTCNNGYSTTECHPDHYCRPEDPSWCIVVHPSCTPGGTNTCPNDPGPPQVQKVCSDLGNNVGLCMTGCTYSVSSDGVYNHSCKDYIGAYPSTCAPIGGEGVCIEASKTGDSANPCNNGSRLCSQGSVCQGGVCRTLCSPGYTCPNGTCQDIGTGFSACIP